MLYEKDFCNVNILQKKEKIINYDKYIIGGFFKLYNILAFKMKRKVYFNICPKEYITDTNTKGIYFSSHYVGKEDNIYLDNKDQPSTKSWNILNTKKNKKKLNTRLCQLLKINLNELTNVEYSIWDEAPEKCYDYVKEGKYLNIKTFLKNSIRKHTIKITINDDKYKNKQYIRNLMNNSDEIVVDEYVEYPKGFFVPEGYQISFYNSTDFINPYLDLIGPVTVSESYPVFKINNNVVKSNPNIDVKIKSMNDLLTSPIQIKKRPQRDRYVFRGYKNYDSEDFKRVHRIFEQEDKFRKWWYNKIVVNDINLDLLDPIIINQLNNITSSYSNDEKVFVIPNRYLFYKNLSFTQKIKRFRSVIPKIYENYKFEDLYYFDELNETNCSIYNILIPYINMNNYPTDLIEHHPKLKRILLNSKLNPDLYAFFGEDTSEIKVQMRKYFSGIDDNFYHLISEMPSPTEEFGMGKMHIKYAQQFTGFEYYLNLYGKQLLEELELDTLSYDEKTDDRYVTRYVNTADSSGFSNNKTSISNRISVQEKNKLYGRTIEPINYSTVQLDNEQNNSFRIN